MNHADQASYGLLSGHRVTRLLLRFDRYPVESKGRRLSAVLVVGHGQSELDDYLAAAAKRHGRYVLPDTEPEKGYFFRSDHFSFAKIGVPALYAAGGFDHIEKGKEWAETIGKDWIEENYHRPSDEYDTTMYRLSGIVDDARLLFEIGVEIAMEDRFPEWKAGSEFKAVRQEQMKPK